MSPAPLAPYLRTIPAAIRGRAADQRAVRAMTTRARGFVRLVVAYSDWSWRLWYVNDPRPGMAQGVDAKGRKEVRRVWISLAWWDSPGAVNVRGDVELGIPPLRYVTTNGQAPTTPAPIELPWNSAVWKTGTAPVGMAGDFGLLVDYDQAGTKGWEIHGMRRPNVLEAVALAWRSKPWLFGTPTFLPTDWVCDEMNLRTGPDDLGHGPRVRGGKRRGIVTRAEIEAGVIEHAISVVTHKTNHGPEAGRTLDVKAIGPARCVLPARRVEKPNVDPCPTNRTPAGEVPGVNGPDGTGFAITITDDEIEQELDRLGLINQARTTARVLVVALRDYGWEWIEKGCGPDDLIETDGELPGLTAVTSMTLLDRIVTPERTYVLEPAA